MRKLERPPHNRAATPFFQVFGGPREVPAGDKWAMRGAANAGLVVFLYLDQMVRGQITSRPPYNHCELLKP